MTPTPSVLLDALLCPNMSKPRTCRKAFTVTGIDGALATWGEARAECLANGRSLCTLAQLNGGGSCTFDRGMGGPLWTRSPCYSRSAGATPSGYTPIRRMGTQCSSSDHQIADYQDISFEQCLRRCDSTTGIRRSNRGHRMFLPTLRCATVGYSFVTRDCRLLRVCNEREATSYGQCQHGYMLQPQDQLWTYLRRFNRSGYFRKSQDPNFAWCHFTRGPTTVTSTFIRKRKRINAARRESETVRAHLEAQHPNATICKAPLLRTPGELVGPTWSKSWRYYTALECGTAMHRRICLTFKKMGLKAVLGGLLSSDGLSYGNRSEMLQLPTPPWHESMFTHNLAVLALGGDEFAMLGGMQGFMSNATCRSALRRSRSLDPALHHAACLQLDRRELYTDTTSQDEQPEDAALSEVEVEHAPPSNGIRLSRGHGLPWDASRWTSPRTVITGDNPANCADRRPHYTGYPRLTACQFDGRLSLARDLGGRFLLYARANLRSGQIAGGRFVQVTHSTQLQGGWAPWQPVSILGVDSSSMDVYFFAVQTNPVDRTSLLALFPLTEPPFACVAFAVSVDGIHFSRPVNLRQSPLGVRPSDSDMEWRGAPSLEWRGEDHPVAGATLAPLDSSAVLFYVHHAVKGTTIRKNAIPHVRVYRLDAAELLRETTRGLRDLRHSV